MRLPLLLALPLAAAACGGDSGFAGDYQTTSIASNQTECGGTLAPEAIPPEDQFFRLADDSLLGARLVGWHHCTAAGVCEEDFDWFASFGKEDGEWRRGAFSWGGNPCHVFSFRAVLTRLEDGSIQVFTTNREGDVAELGDCSPDSPVEGDDVEPFVDSLPCVGEERLLATELL
jgi:hypothetical protein